MTRKSLLITKSKKTIRKSKTETYLINLKYMGDEPAYTAELSNIDYIKAFNWYNSMIDENEARDFMYDFFKKEGRSSLIAKLKKVPFERFKKSAIWTLRISMRGGIVDADKISAAMDSIIDSTKYMISSEEKNTTEQKPSIQDRIKDKISDLIADIEGIIDDEEYDTNFYDWFKARDVPSMYMNKIIEKYAPVLEELVLAYKGKDADLKEAYRHLNKKQLEKRIKFFHGLVGDAEKYGDVAKKVRKPRKNKAVSAEKKLKYMKVQAESKEYKIASINIQKILGAQELWVFNTKYKTLTVFRAIDRGGLDVSRSSIINYDEKTSVTKRIGRKTEYFVDKALNGGKIALRKLMDEIKGEAVLQHRMNENTILLRVL